jgi:hypothetical protein
MPHDDHESTSELAERGRSLLLGVLVIFCAISAFNATLQFVDGSKPFVALIRFGLSVLLAYVVFRGSFAARVIFSVLCVLGSLMSLYTAVVLLLADLQSRVAVTFLLWGGFYTLAAWAPWSRPVLAYWNSRQPDLTDRES